MAWCVLPCWQGIQHFPPSILVSLLDSRCSKEIATVSVGICGCVLLFDTWRLLQECRLGIQRSSIYAILAIMMASLVFHATVASVAEFGVLRMAIPKFEKYGHKFNKAGSSDCWVLNHLNLSRRMGSWEVTLALNPYATYVEVVGRRWVFIPPRSLCLLLLISEPLLVSLCG